MSKVGSYRGSYRLRLMRLPIVLCYTCGLGIKNYELENFEDHNFPTEVGMDEHKKANLALWNEWTDIHEKSKGYDLESFKKGRNSLHSIELEEIGAEIIGKKLLHLQCHFGMDTLSWARMGAQVTGVDFSDKAIRLARSLSRELAIPAEFIQSDIYDLPDKLAESFDIVYTSYGVLAWLSDLPTWGNIISRFLKVGGVFYIVEFHPVFMIFDDADDQQNLKVAYSYFHSPEPYTFDVQGSYADRTAHVDQPVSFEWNHSLSDILNSLISAGLSIQSLREYPFSVDPLLAPMARDENGYYRILGHEQTLPLMFSLKAMKG